MSCAYIAFTETGLKLAEKLALSHPGNISRGGKNGVKLSDWTAENFQKSDALIFIGAVGIAVRAIAPHCKSKATDPAVIVLDERGRTLRRQRCMRRLLRYAQTRADLPNELPNNRCGKSRCV